MPCPEPKPAKPCEPTNQFPYVEVLGPDGSSRRFALGTRANFAVERFNKKLVDDVKPVICVEACKNGEEPVEFGPDAELVSQETWTLRVVQEAPMAPVAVGEKIPDGELTFLDDEGKLQKFQVYDYARKKKVIFFGVPGAFTPTCSLKHVPGFIERGQEIIARGIDEIICLTVNDPFVVKEWEKCYPNKEHLRFLADGSATYTKALGLELDLVDRGMGVRSRRYCLLVDDLFVRVSNIEEGGNLELSTAEKILEDLNQKGKEA